MTQQAADPLTEAAERLDRAAAKVEAAIARLKSRVISAEAAAEAARDSDTDRSRLAEALDAVQARESVLTDAAADASAALGEVIEELRAAAREAEEA